MQIQRFADENEYLSSQITSLQTTIKSQQESITKYQNNENNLLKQLHENKTNYSMVEQENGQLQKELDQEKKATLANKDEVTELKE